MILQQSVLHLNLFSSDFQASLYPIDSRLQPNSEAVTDQQFLNLKAYCETETLVCNRSDFKQLTQEYETLRAASRQLQQAIG